MSDAPAPKPEPTVTRGPNQSVFQITNRRGIRKKEKAAAKLNPDDAWEAQAAERDTSPLRARTKAVLAILLVVTIIAAVIITSRLIRQGETLPPAGLNESYARSPEAIEAFAQAFVDETDPNKRLAMARHPEVVAAHLDDYAEVALTGACESLRPYGRRQGLDISRTAFVARMDDGGDRLLVVMDSDDGLRVDWDAFARYGSAGWPAILAADAQSAEVRVFSSADNYYNTPFEDDTRWQVFNLHSPDTDQPMHGYVEVGSLRERYLSALVARAPEHGLRTVVRITRKGGEPGRHLFEIERLLAVGWVVSDVDLEQQLEESGEEMLADLEAAANPLLPAGFPEIEAGDPK